MAFWYKTLLFCAYFVTHADGGVCFTKMIRFSCYTDTTYFIADSGRLCCSHYDAKGYTDSNRPPYDFNLHTNRHYTSCSSCSDYLESGSVICFTRARHNACWNVQHERKASPKACCEDNLDGGFADNLSLFINPEGYVAHYTCTSCTRLHVAKVWAEWTPYSSCSTSCGYGIQQRYRSCRLPPQIGLCEGGDFEVAPCLIQHCENSSSTTQTHGQSRWSGWKIASSCNVSCGTGVRIRQRHCIGSNCSGSNIDYQKCVIKSCPSNTRSKIGMVILSTFGGIAIATLCILICVCIYWRLKKEKNQRMFDPQHSQSMRVVFMVASEEEQEQEQGIDNLALQCSSDEIIF